MAGDGVGRRLAAILAADVSGYSWLMGSDEARTVRDLKAHQAVLLPMVSEFGGRLIDTAGDGILAEFASAVQAVECAVAIQKTMAERNAAIDQVRRIQLRIGINIGDVIFDEARIYGDGINVAARLEGIAEPGGVCVSEDAYRQTRGKVDVTFTDIGEQSLKNIARQVRAYKVVLDGSSTMAASELPLPSKPSIAILPFQNMSDDLEQEYFADGLAEDIITTLSRSQSLFVIARNSSFAYKGRAVDVKQIARELGVRYLLEGSVRRAGNRVRITAQLIEAVTGNHLWAERYDRDLVDIFAVQDEITEAVATAIEPAVSQTERHRAVHKPPENLGAWEAYQRGLWHMNRGSVTDNQSAQRFFRRAIELDSSFASAHAELTLAIFSAASTYQTMSIAEALDEAVPIADRAIALDPLSAAGYISKSSARIYQGDHQGALDAARDALTISPNYAAAHHFLGVAFLFSGHPREALEPIRRAIRLDPHNPLQINRLCHIAIAYYFLREYETAAAAARVALRSYPDHPLAYRWFAAALGQAGRLDEAKQALTAVTPKSIDMFVRHRAPWYRVEDYEHMLEGLRKAGWEGSEGLALDAMVRLGEQELEAGNHEHALRAANKALAVNNMREGAHRLIVQALAAAGRKAEALKHYQDLVALLKRELNTEPDAATKSLVAELRSTQPAGATPVMSDRRRPEVQAAGDMSEDPEQTVKVQFDATGKSSPALPLPTKPSIAVLAFQNMTDDPEQEYFAEGIAEDIITMLSRSQSLFVIARNSSFTYKGRSVDVKQIARELGVRYVLEGSVRRGGNRVRITAQLVDAMTSNHLWAERYDRELADIFAVQDEITEAVATAIEPAVVQMEQHLAVRKPPESLGAWEAYQRGIWHTGRLGAKNNEAARGFFARAIELDPSFAAAHAELVLAIFYGVSTYQTMSLGQGLDEALPLAHKAIALDPLCAAAHVGMAHARQQQGDHEGTIAAARKAIAISPNYTRAHHFLGTGLLFSGQPREALEALRRAARLDPYDPLRIQRLSNFAIAHYLLREYEAAIDAEKEALRSYPDHPHAYRWLAAALGQAGRLDEAKQALEKLMAIAPKTIDMYVRQRVPWMSVELYEHMLEGLRKAGWEG